MSKRLTMRLLFFSMLLIIDLSCFAHEIKPAKLDIVATGNNCYHVKWTVPITDDKKPKIKPEFPTDFQLVSKGDVLLNNAYTQIFTGYYKEKLTGKKIRIINLEAGLIDVLVKLKEVDGIEKSYLLKPTQTEVIFEEEKKFFSNSIEYTLLGLEHIWGGIDHLLFVLCLLLVSSTTSSLLKAITGFTVGHSITLIISTLEWFTLPGNPIEMLILLSIMYMAYEIIQLNKGITAAPLNTTWGIAFLFGLIHGFGFSGALKEIGIPENQLIASLLFFNMGVELGQIIFISGVLVISITLKIVITNISFQTKSNQLIPYFIGGYSVFLFFELIEDFILVGY
jgi:hypothetical protein